MLPLLLIALLAPAVLAEEWNEKLNQVCEYETDCGDYTLVCTNNTCSYCVDDGQCETGFVCLPTGNNTICERRKLFDSFGGMDVLCTILIFVGSMAASGGGIGGGGIFVPLYIIVLSFTPQEAVPLSAATIFGGSLINLYVYLNDHHPDDPELPLVDFVTIVLLSPLLLAGTVIGVLLNLLFPKWLTLSLLVVTLGYGAYGTAMKARKAWNKESAMIRASSINGDDPEIAPRSSEKVGGATIWTLSQNHGRSSSQEDVSASNAANTAAELRAIIVAETKTSTAAIKIGILWTIAFVMFLLRRKELGIVDGCSAGWWTFTILAAVLLSGFSLFIGGQVRKSYAKKLALGFQTLEGSIEWTPKNVYLYPFVAALAGILGGLLGIGGGMILGPLLLELGMDARQTSATSAFAVFLTASSAAVQYLVLGSLPLDFGAWYFCLGMLATALGLGCIKKAIQKSGRSSLIIISITVVMIVALFMMTIIGIINIKKDIDQDANLGFGSIC